MEGEGVEKRGVEVLKGGIQGTDWK